MPAIYRGGHISFTKAVTFARLRKSSISIGGHLKATASVNLIPEADNFKAHLY
jgi:hypothetical protein